MRGRLIAILTAGLLVLGIGAAAAAPGGSNEDSANNVTCGQSKAAEYDGTQLYAGSDGVTVCNDDGDVQGRIYVDANRGVVAVDGDRDNPDRSGAPSGYVRVGPDGAGCGDNNSEAGGDLTACG